MNKYTLSFLLLLILVIPSFAKAGGGGPSLGVVFTTGSTQSGGTITLTGSVFATGGAPVTTRGFVYGLTTSYGATTTETGSFDVGSYSATVTGLTPHTTYHFKAYITNSVGTAYSSTDLTLFVSTSTDPRLVLASTTATGAFPIGNAVGPNNTAYTISYDTSYVFKYNVANKASPILLGSATTTSQPGYIITQGNYAYISTYPGKLLTYDITASTSPILVSSSTYSTGYALGNIYIADGYLYAVASKTGAGRIAIFSLSNPVVPTLVSEISVGTTGGGDVQKRGNYLYYADYNGKTLQIWDVTDVLNPVQKQLITGVTEPLDYHTFEPFKILIKNDTLYLFDDEIIQTYDISSSTNMVYRTTTVAYRDGEGAVISGNILYYSSTFDHVLAVYDINNPWQPTLVATFNNAGANRFLSMDSDGYVYASVDNTLEIFRAISAPSIMSPSSSDISATGATLTSAITDDNNASSTDKGFNYGLTTSYGSIASTTGVFGVGPFSQSVAGLSCATTYHYRAFARSVVNTATSSDATFTTSACPVVTSSSSNTPSNTSGGSAASASTTSQLLAPGPATTAYLNSLKVQEQNTPVVVSPNSFARDLSAGLTSPDVKTLQHYLNAKGYVVSTSGAGSIGNETTYFGGLTKQALIKFQKAHGIPATGFFGPITRAFITKNP